MFESTISLNKAADAENPTDQRAPVQRFVMPANA